MANHAVPVPVGTIDPPELIVDLDALDRVDKVLIPWRPPVVVDGELVTRTYVSPLGPDSEGLFPTALRVGGVVTDPQEIRAIRRRVEAGVAREARRRAWRRRLRLIRRAGA